MNALTTTAGTALVVDVTSPRLGADRVLAREVVLRSDLLFMRDETWWQGVRCGVLPPDLSAVSLHVVPGKAGRDQRLNGFAVQVRADGRQVQKRFSVACLADVAKRAVLRLLSEKVLQPSDEFQYCVLSVPVADGDQNTAHPPAANGKKLGLKVRSKPQPLILEEASLSEYLQNSEPLCGPASALLDASQLAEPPMEVFVSDEVWQQGHQLARRGGERESAAVWSGRLFRDADSPEVFMRLDACLEAQHAAEEKYAVTFSGETWSHARQLLEQRRRRLGRPHEIFVGSVHGHNFLPEADAHGRRQCETCLQAAVCTRTTAAASAHDWDWHRCVFAGQPWAVLLVWGWNAREEEDYRLFGAHEGGLAARGIRRLKDLD